MKENRFIELLNLYIDRQITAEETAELEAELQRNPKRQAVYRQYCQIHSATKQVYASFRASAADNPATEPAQTGVIELFESRRRRTHWAYYAGGMAAAACLALVFFRQAPTSPRTEALPMASNVKPAATVAVSSAPPSAATVSALEISPVSAGLSDAPPVASPNYSAILTIMREQDEERSFSNSRLQAGRLQPLFEDSLFDPIRANATHEQRVFRSHQTTPAQQAEFSAAFQFQR